MANDTQITVVGNLTADPELRFTNSGVPVANFTVASTPRTFDKQSGQWRDLEALFLRCSVWRDYAEHVADSLRKGMQVIVQGKLVQRSYEKDGQKRTAFELQVDEVGPTLRWSTAQVQRAQRANTSQQSYSPAPGTTTSGYGTAPAGGQEPDPWGTQGDVTNEPPF